MIDIVQLLEQVQGVFIMVFPIASFIALLLSIQASAHHRPEVRIYRDTGGSPLDVLCRPELLTPRGLRYRYWALVFLAIVAFDVVGLYLVGFVLHRMGD